MQRLVLDVDALAHVSGLGLLSHIEVLISGLPERAYMERSAYTEAIRTGLGRVLEDWQRKGLLKDPVDYRALAREGDAQFREARRQWPGLSKADRATLVVARVLGDSGVLTCEGELSAAVTAARILAVDLFDVIRFGVRNGRITRGTAAELCAVWDGDRFSAGRPRGYRGSFEAEWAAREDLKPLP